jgi:hypothetical protein
MSSAMYGGDPELMKPLWEAAAAVQPSNADDPVRYLHTYMQALHYALAKPNPGAFSPVFGTRSAPMTSAARCTAPASLTGR